MVDRTLALGLSKALYRPISDVQGGVVVGVIPDPDRDPDEDLKAEAGEWGMPLQRELRATLHSYMED